MTGRIERVEYTATPTLTAFHESKALVRIVRGPVGSGKSTACCWELWRRANEQPKAANGKRQTAFLVVRNTYRELKDTTIATWLDWFSETRIGKFNYGDHEHRIEFGDLECTIMFRSLDKPQDIKKILSLEVTGAWFNECREIARTAFNRTAERVGRYPPAKDGGALWWGIIGDTNPPDEDHWLAEMEGSPPEGWEFFIQPPGLIEGEGGRLVTNPEAENLGNLPPNYYTNNLGAMKVEEINVYRRNRFGMVVDGRPVTPEFDPHLHVTDLAKPIAGQPLLLGIDAGGGTLNPAAVLFQRHPRGAYLIFGEVICSDMGLELFGRMIRQTMAELVPDHVAMAERDPHWITAYADPAGAERDELYETAVFEHLRRAVGITVRGAPSQDIKLRIDAVRAPMTRLIDGRAGLLVHPRCRKLIRAFSGGWYYRRLQVHGREAFTDKPDKGEYSHVADAACYGLLGAGEMRALRALDAPGQKRARPFVAAVDFNAWGDR